jgi:membrane protease YdiL (CAAX protease family)
MTPMAWMKPVWTIIWKTVLFVIVWGIMLAPFIVPFADRIKEMEQSYPLQTRLYYDFISAITVVFAAWVMVRFIERRALVTIGFARGRIMRDCLLGLGLGATWLGLSVAALWICGWTSPGSFGTISVAALAWAAAAMAFNTLAQEVLTRSYIFQTIKSQSNPVWAIVLTSLLFVAVHAGVYRGAILPAINVFAAGVLFAVAYHVTGNLWLPTAIHFMWNYLLGPVLGLVVSGQTHLRVGWQLFTVQGPSFFTGGAFGLEGGIITTLTTVGTTLLLLLIFRRKTV